MARLRRPRNVTSTCGRVGSRPAGRRRPLDADDLGAHVGEQHRGERTGTDAGDLDDPVAGQRPRHDVIRCERLSASEGAVISGLRGRGTQWT